MQQITLVFWWHAHTNISSLQIFPLQRIEKNNTNPTNLYDIKQLQVRPVQHSYHGFVAVLWGFSAAIIAKRPWSWGWQKRWRGNLKSANFRHFLWKFCLVFCLWDPTRDPQNEPVYDCIGGEHFYPQTFPWENNKMIHATTALPIGSMYEISISVGIPYMNQSWAVIVLLMFFWRCLSQKLEKHQKIDGIIFACP